MALIDRENGQDGPPRLIPVLRARIVGVRGSEVNLESYEEVQGPRRPVARVHGHVPAEHGSQRGVG